LARVSFSPRESYALTLACLLFYRKNLRLRNIAPVKIDFLKDQFYCVAPRLKDEDVLEVNRNKNLLRWLYINLKMEEVTLESVVFRGNKVIMTIKRLMYDNIFTDTPGFLGNVFIDEPFCTFDVSVKCYDGQPQIQRGHPISEQENKKEERI
jgi:hypothetical protein